MYQYLPIRDVYARNFRFQRESYNRGRGAGLVKTQWDVRQCRREPLPKYEAVELRDNEERYMGKRRREGSGTCQRSDCQSCDRNECI